MIPFIFIFTAFYSTTWNGILTGYTVECMSYDIRAKLICTQNLLVQATITGFNYLNPVALKQISWKYYIAICAIILLEIVMVYFTYPESKSIVLLVSRCTFCSTNMHLLRTDTLPMERRPADFIVASKITLEEVSIIFDGKHAVQNDLLVKQENNEEATEPKGVAVERQEVAVSDA